MDTNKVVQSLLERIPDLEVRKFTEYVLSSIPDELWKIPATSSHHLEDERGEYGNLIHTVRDFRICEILADISNMGLQDRSELLSSALLHDLRKRGSRGEIPYTHDDHPWWMADFIESVQHYYPGKERIAMYVRCHMGRWSTFPIPVPTVIIHPGDALHIADAVEAHLGEVLGEIDK